MSKELLEKTKELIEYVITTEKIDMECINEKVEELKRLSEIPSKNIEDRNYKIKSTILLNEFKKAMEESIEEIENREFFKKMDKGEI